MIYERVHSVVKPYLYGCVIQTTTVRSMFYDLLVFLQFVLRFSKQW